MSQAGCLHSLRSRAVRLLLCTLLGAFVGDSVRAEETTAPAPAPAASFVTSSLPAAGRQHTELSVSAFGRYSLRVASARGTALQVVDRMSGGGDVAGQAGETDGRLDLFLDRGVVRVMTYGANLVTGEAKLTVTPFHERHPGVESRLVEGKPLDDELGDFEQSSWWLDLHERRRVVFEAAGRSLADLRLWQNGAWLVDVAPAVSTIEPHVGQPLRLCQLTADLGPGLYRLTAYGGLPLAWANGGTEQPFHLRFGWPSDARTVRERRTIGPFGNDRVLVSGAVDYFRLELPDAPVDDGQTTIQVTAFNEADPFAPYGPLERITKENVPPVAELLPGPLVDRLYLLTVEGTPGQSYVLQHFEREKDKELNPRAVKSDYWISTVHAGPPGDAIDPTAILVRSGSVNAGQTGKAEVVASDAVDLSRATGWARRFNLPEAATLFLKIQEAGAYRLVSRGVAAQFRLEPLFLGGVPEGYASPPAVAAPAEWTLDPGYYRLTLIPLESGIAEIELAGKEAPPQKLAPPRPSVQLGVVSLSSARGYHLFVSQQPGVESGLIARELPLDLAEALPLALGAGEEVAFTARAAAPSRLKAVTEDGGTLDVAVDDGAWSAEVAVDKGEHRVRVRSTRDATVLASVGLVSDAKLSSTPLPDLPQATLDSMPTFPALGEPAGSAATATTATTATSAPTASAASTTLDLARSEARTFVFSATAPALYRIESTGLLATGGALRTRTRASLLSEEANGVGRNFNLATYLREGDYQLTVHPVGESAGHLGLEIARAPIEAGGELALGLPLRTTVDPGRALAFDLEIADAGKYRLTSRGLRKDFSLRFEDADGWPVAQALAEGELEVDLEAGKYRLIVLPQPVTARAVIGLQRVETAEDFSGHGPHPLAPGTASANLWLEPREGELRAPDLWRFSLPATTVAKLTLSEEMEGEIRLRKATVAAGARDAVIGQIPPGRAFQAALAAGEYEIAVTSSRSNNRVRYEIALQLGDLVDGTEVGVVVPGELTLAVGAEAQVEISSSGRRDVRATLSNELGEPIASSDDRPGDWNFLISERLAAGRYRLRVDPVDGGSSPEPTRVAMRVLRERAVPEVAATGSATTVSVAVADEALLLPISRPATAEIFAVGARSKESLGLVLEERQPESAHGGAVWKALRSVSGTVMRLALPLAPSSGALRVRLWSLDRRPAKIALSLYAGAFAHVREAALVRGFALTPLAGVDPPLAAAIVDLDDPGCFARSTSSADGASGGLLQALAIGSTFDAAAPTLASIGLALPLAAPFEGATAPRVQARRVRLGQRDDSGISEPSEPGEGIAISLPSRTPVICDVADGEAAVVALEAQAGEPMVGFVDGSGKVGPATAVGIAGNGGARVLSAAAAGKGRAVELWNAGDVAVEGRLSAWLGKSTAERTAAFGTSAATVPAGGVTVVSLPRGEKELRLTLGEGTAALAIGPDGAAEELLWAPVAAANETLSTASERLLVFGGTTTAGLVSIDLAPADESGPPAARGRVSERDRFEKRFLSSSAFRLEVSGPEKGTRQLHVRGAEAAVYVSGDGRVERGTDFAVASAGGSLRFTTDPGLVSAWVDEEEKAEVAGGALAASRAASWGIDPAQTAQAVTLPAALPLDGETKSFEFSLPAPALFRLRGATAFAVAVIPEATTGTTRFEVYPDSVHLDAVLPAGRCRLVLRALAGETLSGSATLASQALTPLGEGLSPEILLAPGDSYGFSFHIAQESPVGMGVRADVGGVETVLYGGDGRRLGAGVVQWSTLAAGDFALVVTAPAAGRPARVRAALVGSTPPGSGPPPEEAHRFLELAAGGAPVVVGVAGTENEPVDWLADGDASDAAGEDSSYDESSDEETGDRATEEENDPSDPSHERSEP
ncbi:MAG: hypothetical protein ABI639_12535 [Thermoanaerobaculia bacterium]